MRIASLAKVNRRPAAQGQWPNPAIMARCLCTMLALFVVAGCSGPALAPTPNLYLSNAGDPFDAVAPEFQSNLVEIFYATDRAPIETDDGTVKYGYGRSPSLAAGTCTVTIGNDMTWSDLVQASRTPKRTARPPLRLTAIHELVRFPDSSTPMIDVDGELSEDPAYLKARIETEAIAKRILSDRLARTSRKEVYLFIHGYNNTFDDAAFRIAQLWHFMGREGVPILYTWPAGRGGVLRGYNYDRESGEFTILHLRRFIEAIASNPDVEKLHIIAHSRGTDVAITALRELNLQYTGAGLDTRTELKLANLILAAADLDWEVANQRLLAERLVRVPERFTIYLSRDDLAIGIASWLFDSIRRIGDLLVSDLSEAQREALKESGMNARIQVINVKVKTDFLGHGYFISNPAVLSDLILILRDNRPPGAENGRPLLREEGGFWELYDGYPFSGRHAPDETTADDQ